MDFKTIFLNLLHSTFIMLNIVTVMNFVPYNPINQIMRY